jgi:thioredoxin reductase (NADPH)
MSSSPAFGAPNAETQTWPILTEAEIDRARPYGRVRQAQLGEILYRPGDVGVPCYILLSATVQIAQPSIDGERLVTNHCPGTFTGEAGMIAGQRALVLARVIQGGEVLELRPADLRTFVARDPRLNELFLRAFVLRRLLLINRQLGNVVVIGSRHSADTLRLREFLGRNGHPYTYVDLDLDDASRNFLDRFAIGVSEIPIVICNGTTVLRNPSTSQLADLRAQIGSRTNCIVFFDAEPDVPYADAVCTIDQIEQTPASVVFAHTANKIAPGPVIRRLSQQRT